MSFSEKITRRGFISTTLTGAVSMGVLGCGSSEKGAEEKEKLSGEKKKGRVITRKLGSTGMEMPIVGMGVMNSDNPEVVRAAYQNGIRHFDTAAVYQGGNNERMVGNVIKELGVRNEVTVGTKIYHSRMRKEDHTAAEVRKSILSQMDESLERLQMDHVDIVYLHAVQSEEEITNEAIHDAMEELKKSGRTRSIGVSTHRSMQQVLNAVASSGLYDVVLTVYNFTLGDYAQLIEAIDKAHAAGVGIIAMKTQAGSHRHSKIEISDQFKSSTVATAALKWVLRNEKITAAIPGFTTFEHMEEDFSVATSLEYTRQEKKLLNECDVKYTMGFCRQCDLCLDTCRRQVDIPELMRVHMYSTRYSNFHRARVTLDTISPERGLINCSECESCSAFCPHQVNIAGAIDELKLIYC